MDDERRHQVGSTALFAVLVAYIFGFPFLVDSPAGRAVAAVLAALLPVFALLAVSVTGWRLHLGIALGGPAILAILHGSLALDLVSPVVGQSVPTIFFAYVTIVLVSEVVRTQKADTAAVLHLLSGYLLLGYTWWSAYLSLEIRLPGSFRSGAASTVTPGDLLYFSVVTLTTLGYGDVAPVSREARSLAMLEALAGVLYLAVLVARLVAAYSQRATER